MTNISYILLFIISTSVSFVWAILIYYLNPHGYYLDLFIIYFVTCCFFIYFLMLRFFHPVDYKTVAGGIVYLLTFSYIPLIIDMLSIIEGFVSWLYSFLSLDEYNRNYFLVNYEVTIYLAFSSLIALSITWVLDLILTKYLKIKCLFIRK